LGALLKPLVYLSVPIIIAAWFTPLGYYYVRLGVYIALLSSVGSASTFIGLAMTLVGRKYDVNNVVAYTFYWITSRMLNITVELEGEEHLQTRPAVMVGNHQSMLDILWLGRIFPQQASIMAKKSIQWNPVLGPFMNLSGTVFVDRGNSAKAHRSLEAAGEGMKARQTSIFIFVEGTRHSEETPTLLPFKKGAFHLAQKGGIPIIPVVVENYWRLYHKGVFGTGIIRVKVLPPVATTDLTAEDITPFSNRLRDQMLTTLREISVKVSTSESGDKSDDRRTPTPRAPSVPIEAGPRNEGVPSIATITSSRTMKKEGSETGTETEEDEGMVLVGRPG